MPPRFTSTRFVGREAAFVRLAATLDAAAEGRSSTLLIAGSGGMGVSRFLSEAANRLGTMTEPFSLLRGRAQPAGADEPYAPVGRPLAALLEGLSDDQLRTVLGTSAEDLIRLIPGLGERPAVRELLPARPTTTSPERRQAKVMESILGVLGRLGEHRPIVLVVEDLHRAD